MKTRQYDKIEIVGGLFEFESRFAGSCAYSESLERVQSSGKEHAHIKTSTSIPDESRLQLLSVHIRSFPFSCVCPIRL
jgi:hypothetical protein